MDSSRSHQSAALTYLLDGVRPAEIRNPAERLVALKAKLEVLFAWVPDTPGFHPYGLKVYGLEARYQKGISGKTKVMVLSQLGFRFRPAEKLLVTTEGQLLTDSRQKSTTPGAPDVVRIIRCSDDQAERFFLDEWVLVHSCEAINRAIGRRIDKLHKEFNIAMEIQCRMGGTIWPETL